MLDVGCGQGELTTGLAVAGYDVLGIDPLAPQGDRFRRILLEDLGVEEGPFDVVVAIRCITSATSGRRSTGSSRCCAPQARSCSTSTVGISPTRRRSTGSTTSAARSRRPGRKCLPRSTCCATSGAAEHVGLHGFDALRTEVDARFDERAFVRAPFLYRLLGGVAAEVLEQALIDAGAIQALAFRYAGVVRAPEG